jgi:hypothetical protein
MLAKLSGDAAVIDRCLPVLKMMILDLRLFALAVSEMGSFEVVGGRRGG